MQNNSVKKLTYGGLMIALVFVATAIIPQIPVPFTEGYIHAGDSMIFVAAILLGWKYGAIAGGLGSSLADIYLGYTHWAIPTLIIKGIMGAIVGFIVKDIEEGSLAKVKKLLTVIIGGGWVFFGVALKNYLAVKLGNIQNSELANYLVKKFDLKGISELQALIDKVQTSLLVAIILIPLFVVILSVILKKKGKEMISVSNLMGMTLAGLWMVIGYYIAGGILKGNMIVPIFSVPANILQFVGGLIIAYPVVLGLKRTNYIKNI
ncbi:ECF transporter S component [Caloranaerobacter sp. TR13]|uniref:ECF transporter S component n=1 Tax=Caloranaerobacter sp. TR13 TaxID=1302151 RepID=UPI0006D42B25|nr:ECF transporter S component [Caloranaerobacter sp. TR13]